MNVRKLTLGLYQTNTYILSNGTEAAVIDPGYEPDTILDALEGLSSAHAGVTAADEILHRMACRSAVKGGDKNNMAELSELVNILLTDDNVRYCPHGRPVMLRFTRRELEKMFGRIQK